VNHQCHSTYTNTNTTRICIHHKQDNTTLQIHHHNPAQFAIVKHKSKGDSDDGSDHSWGATVRLGGVASKPGVARAGRGSRTLEHLGGRRRFWYGLASSPAALTDRGVGVSREGKWCRHVVARGEEGRKETIREACSSRRHLRR